MLTKKDGIRETQLILKSLGRYNGPIEGELNQLSKDAFKSGKRLLHQYANNQQICFEKEELRWLRAMVKIQESFGIECSKFNSVQEMEELVVPLGKFIPPGGHIYLSRQDQQRRMIKAIVNYENEDIEKLGKHFITVHDCKLDNTEMKFLRYNLAKLNKYLGQGNSQVNIPKTLEKSVKEDLTNSLEALESRMFSIYESIEFDIFRANKMLRDNKLEDLEKFITDGQKYDTWAFGNRRKMEMIYRDIAHIGKALRILKKTKANSSMSVEDRKVLSIASNYVSFSKNKVLKAKSNKGVPIKISEVNSRAYKEGNFTNILATMILEKDGKRLRAFKINGHWNAQSNKFFVDEFCPDNIKKPCFNARYFTGVNYRKFEKHLTTLKEDEIDAIAAKCFALTDMYSDFYGILKGCSRQI